MNRYRGSGCVICIIDKLLPCYMNPFLVGSDEDCVLSALEALSFRDLDPVFGSRVAVMPHWRSAELIVIDTHEQIK